LAQLRLTSLIQRLRRRLEPSTEWLSRQAARKHCTLQVKMDIDDDTAWFPAQFRSRFGGFHPPGEVRRYYRMRGTDRIRSDLLVLLLREVEVANIPGAMAELGVYQGDSARLIHHYCPKRRLYLLDTFEGFAEQDLRAESLSVGFNQQPAFGDTSIERVRRLIEPVGDTVEFVPGWFPDSATPAMRADHYAFVHLDADLEKPIAEALRFFWPRLSPGGIVVVHDYNGWPGARIAVDDFRRQERLVAVPMPDKCGSVVLVKPLTG